MLSVRCFPRNGLHANLNFLVMELGPSTTVWCHVRVKRMWRSASGYLSGPSVCWHYNESTRFWRTKDAYSRGEGRSIPQLHFMGYLLDLETCSELAVRRNSIRRRPSLRHTTMVPLGTLHFAEPACSIKHHACEEGLSRIQSRQRARCLWEFRMQSAEISYIGACLSWQRRPRSTRKM